MSKQIMKIRCIYKIFILLSASAGVIGQTQTDKPKMCTDHPRDKGKYELLSTDLGKELQIRVAVKPKNRNDGNYVAIAKEFKERYCDYDRIAIIYYYTRKQWFLLYGVHDPGSTPLAIFYTGQDSNEPEGINVYTTVDGKVKSRRIGL